MEKFRKDLLKQLKEERTNYRSMIEFCCDSLILNNYIIEELQKDGFYFETYCGSDLSYYDENGDEITYKEYLTKEENGEEVEEIFDDIYQYFIISGNDAERLANYTNELVYYNDKLDIYLLGVKHFGTSWDIVSPNWKDPEEDEEEDEEE